MHFKVYVFKLILYYSWLKLILSKEENYEKENVVTFDFRHHDLEPGSLRGFRQRLVQQRRRVTVSGQRGKCRRGDNQVGFRRGSFRGRSRRADGNPSADVWFGGTTDPYNEAASAGLLEPYEAINASHLINDQYRDADGNWYGIYKGILGFMVNTDELERKGLDAPKDWADLLDEKYKGLIWLSNYNTAGTAKLVVNTMIQKMGHDEGIQYLVDLDKNIEVYTKSGSGPSKNIGTGECTIGIGFLHDGITQIVDNGYGNISLIIPSSGTSFEVGATAIFKGCKHPNAAKLWVEYALSPECVELAAENGSYQFLVIDNAKQPEVADEFGLDPDNVMEYDFEDAKQNTSKYVEDVMQALHGGDDRFKTE